MIVLPRGVPVKEKINPARVNLPESLKRLRASRFSGYLRFEAPDAQGVVAFVEGRVHVASFRTDLGAKEGEEALGALFELAIEGRSALSIYRLGPPLALDLCRLLLGSVRQGERAVEGVDFRGLLAALRDERFTGGIAVHAAERAALIFYREGRPLGFFDDGTADLATQVDLSNSVARMAQARFSLLDAAAEGDLPDLLDGVDLVGLWTEARSGVERRMRMRRQEARQKRERREERRREEALALLKGAAEAHLGKRGVALAEKEFENALQGRGEIDEEFLEAFCCAIARTARLLAPAAAVDAMLDAMRRGVGALR